MSHLGTLEIKRSLSHKFATYYFLVNIFLYHKTVTFGTVVISTGRQQRGEQERGVFC